MIKKCFELKKRKYGIIGLGEIMLRLSAPVNEMIFQGKTFDKQIGGSELNVAAGLESLGIRSAIISKIPNNELGRFVKKNVRAHGVSDDFLIYDESVNKRLGIYYYEYGAYPRKPTVIYDRDHSSFMNIKINELNNDMFKKAEIFHLSGITLGLSKELGELSLELIKKFKETGTLVSFDVNFRSAIWSEEEAKRTIEKILPYVDILFISEESLRKMFGKTGELENIIKNFSKENNIKIIATTKRIVVSPKKHDFSSLIYNGEENQFYTSKPYLNIDVVDRIGSGDAYLSGVLFGILKHNNLEKALDFGNAMSVLKNTVTGDLSCVDLKLVERTIKDYHSNKAVSELNR
ncbi:MAG: sugar kinase [Fusobacteriaceae bacterium]